MKLVYTLLIVGVATLLLVTANSFTNKITFQLHTNEFVNGLFKYQIFAFLIAISVSFIILKLNPDSKDFLSKGNLKAIAVKEKWLGINGQSNWKKNGMQLLVVVSIATALFMIMALKYTASLNNFQWYFIPFVLLFSITNSLTEELIFRFGILGGLVNEYPKWIILALSALFFGLPHYFGWPSGFMGVLMAGILGYILCKATLETKGLAIAWVIHFVQDVIIFTALFMMNIKA